MKISKLYLCTMLLLSASHSWAGKPEEVQAAIKAACSKDITTPDALRYVKSLYLTCASGQKVQVDGCNVPCLKSNSGAVVGE